MRPVPPRSLRAFAVLAALSIAAIFFLPKDPARNGPPGRAPYRRNFIDPRPTAPPVAVPVPPQRPAAAGLPHADLPPEERAYCRILAANAGLPLGGTLKIWTNFYENDEDNEAGFVAFIQSSECPDGLFSKIRMDHQGRIKESVDCRSATREEIFTGAGIQGDLEEHPTAGDKLNLAISGEGYFVMSCDEGLVLQRSGDFLRRGDVVAYGGCRVLARDGGDFIWDGGDIDENGCTRAGSCLALVTPDPRTVTFIDRTNYRAHADPFDRPARYGKIMNHALEILDDPESGPTGPSWAQRPVFKKPSACD